jgi:hypothetical protein
MKQLSALKPSNEPSVAAEQIAALREAGVHRLICQHLLHDDLEAVALIGRELPALL